MNQTKKNVLICDTQPVAVEGMKWLLDSTDDLRFGGSVLSADAVYAMLSPAAALAQAQAPSEDQESGQPLFDVIVIDKGLGLLSVIGLLEKLAAVACPVPAVVWGSTVNESEALRLLQFGARGILRRTSESGRLLTCLRAVVSGGTWMEDGIFGEAGRYFRPVQPQLTAREQQIAELVERGLRNRDIAGMLGIQPGTVKIHVKHIFEKTGVRRRFGLALTGLQRRGSIGLPLPPQYTA